MNPILLARHVQDSLRELVRKEIRVDTAWPDLGAQIAEGEHTSHLCVVDGEGKRVDEVLADEARGAGDEVHCALL